MSLEVLFQNSNGETYDISELVTIVSFDDNINKSGVVNFGVIDTGVIPMEGNTIRIKYDGLTYFLGYVFKVGMTNEAERKITAYDQLRHLKTNETYVFPNMTASEVVKKICSDFGRDVGEIQDTGYRLGSQIFDNKDLLDIIADCLNITLVNTRQLFFIKDNNGVVELKNITTTVSDLCIDPEHLLFDFNYERSIDGNTFNVIKLVRDNKSTGEREVYIAKDSSNIQKWGLLQLYEKVDDNMNPEQVKQKADGMLKIKNRVEQKLSVEVIGEKSIRAGNVLYIDIPNIGVKKFLLCISAKHTFDNTGHTVKAEFKMV
ncbi:MAG: hypothetical protein VB130_11235 [Clostridium sp.]|nr:hypothetical protein [Clostridium sp.]